MKKGVSLAMLVLIGLISLYSFIPQVFAKNTSSAETAEEFVEWFINLAIAEDEEALRTSLADDFVYRDERSSLKEYHFEFDAELYLIGVLSDWESLETLDIKIVRIRTNNSGQSGVVSVSAYFDVWLRDDYGIMGPLRQVYHFELIQKDNRWLISKLTWAA